MSREELIQEIVRRVMQKILECEKNSSPSSNVTSNQSSACSCCSCTEPQASNVSTPAKDMHVDKRLLSERDVIDAVKAGVTELHYSKKTIVTDLAKDYAARHKLCLVKD